MNKRVLLIMSVVCMVLISSLTAFAQVAPISTSTTLTGGFPDFIVDSAGLQLGLCNVDNGVDALGEALGPCLLEAGVTNYWAADAIVEDLNAGTRYLVGMSISAIVEPGLRMLSNEIVVRIRNSNGLPAGNYTVITPYKTYTLVSVPGQDGRLPRDIREVDGVENLIAGVGDVPPIPGPPFAIDGPVKGNLLTTCFTLPLSAACTADPTKIPPAGFVGTGAEVISSPLDAPGPNGGVFKVIGPPNEATGPVLAETNEFSVQGKLFAGAPGVPGVPGAVVADTVTIRATTFNARRGILTIRVASSVPRPRPTFTATTNAGGVVTVRGGTVRVTGLPAGLNSVTVVSSGGGTASFSVTVP